MTSVRDLLDVAAAELDALSCRITLGERPPPAQMAAGWSRLLPAAQHLIRQSVGPHTKVHRETLHELDELQAPAVSRPATPLAATVRAARAMGGAGDLLTAAVLRSAPAERHLLLGEATRLLAASAEVTLHGLATRFDHSSTMVCAATAGGLAHRLGQSAWPGSAPSRALDRIAAPAPALPLSHPLGPLAHAVHDWERLASRVVEKSTLSSHDLRGAALVAGQLTLAVRCLLAQGPPDATSPTDERLDAYGRAWSEAARQWTRYALPGAADRELAVTSWRLSAELQSTFVREGRWTSSSAADLAITPFSAARLRVSILEGLSTVADAHNDAVVRAAQMGCIAAHTRTSSHVVDRLGAARSRWRPARPDDLHPLVSAYGRVARSPRDGYHPSSSSAAWIQTLGQSPRDLRAPRPVSRSQARAPGAGRGR